MLTEPMVTDRPDAMASEQLSRPAVLIDLAIDEDTPTVGAEVIELASRFGRWRSRENSASFTAATPELESPTDNREGRPGSWSERLAPQRDPMLVAPAPPPIREQFVARQQWEGYVESISADEFFARLVGVIGDRDEVSSAIPMEDVHPEDTDLVQVGAVFYWTIGYYEGPSGRRRSSDVRFRRMPRWSKRDVDRTLREAKIRAERLRALIDDSTAS